MTTPGYMTGTYLGKRKKVLNVEAGITSQKNATSAKAVDTLYSNMTLWSVGCLSRHAIELEKELHFSLSRYF